MAKSDVRAAFRRASPLTISRPRGSPLTASARVYVVGGRNAESHQHHRHHSDCWGSSHWLNRHGSPATLWPALDAVSLRSKLERELDVTYKTAWRMFNRIRKLMTNTAGLLAGEGGVDETYVGPSRERRKGQLAPGDGRVAIFGMVQRPQEDLAQKIIALAMPDAQRESLFPEIEMRVLPKSIVYTYEFVCMIPSRKLGSNTSGSITCRKSMFRAMPTRTRLRDSGR